MDNQTLFDTLLRSLNANIHATTNHHESSYPLTMLCTPPASRAATPDGRWRVFRPGRRTARMHDKIQKTTVKGA